MKASLDEEEQKALVHKADMYIITQQWTINILPSDAFNIVLQQPYIKGLANVEEVSIGQKYARCWIDQAMKKAMGVLGYQLWYRIGGEYRKNKGKKIDQIRII